MDEVPLRLAVGIVLVLLVTAVLAGTVATAAAVSGELSDGDGCETGGSPAGGATVTPENVTALAGNVTDCLASGEGARSSGSTLPAGAE